MIIDQPTWYLKESCPCCGQGQPAFFVCANCGFVTLVCFEVDVVFANPRAIIEGGITDVCPSCNADVNKMVQATPDQIMSAGFSKDEFE